MKTKITRPDLGTWILASGSTIISERLASAISTNIYLDNRAVLALYDNDTVTLQGKPTQEFIHLFNELCIQTVALPLEDLEDSSAQPNSDRAIVSRFHEFDLLDDQAEGPIPPKEFTDTDDDW
jgi:hypothetical protein